MSYIDGTAQKKKFRSFWNIPKDFVRIFGELFIVIILPAIVPISITLVA